jgi:hypothetical protein
MMKNRLLFILPVLALLSFAAAPALAADEAAPAAAHRHDAKKHDGAAGKDFKTVQKERLKRIDAHIEKLKKGRACVAAATDSQALAACLPKRTHHAKKGGTTHHDKADGASHHDHHADDAHSGQ